MTTGEALLQQEAVLTENPCSGITKALILNLPLVDHFGCVNFTGHEKAQADAIISRHLRSFEA